MVKKVAIISIIGVIIIALLPGAALAQSGGQPVVVGKKYSIQSKVLNEERSYSVHLPRDYHNDQQGYPVLYLLDGNWLALTALAVGTVDYLNQLAGTPKVIVVGIFNTVRNRDMIPAAVVHRPGSGGSDKFLQFITTELMPHIKKNYRTRPVNILYGGSNAGLLAVYAFLKKPHHFQACLASSPMIGHCSAYIYQHTREFFKAETPANRCLYMIYGKTDSARATDTIPTYYKFLVKNNQGKFKVAMKLIADDGHVPYTSFFYGLKFIFSSLTGI